MAQKFNQDMKLAKRVRRELRSGRAQAVLELYNAYQPLFFNFTMRRLYAPSPDRAEKVLSDFWVELLNGRALGAYEGRASLKTYLLVILNRRILDHNARHQKRRRRFTHADDFDQSPAVQESPEDRVFKSQRKQLLAQTLAALERTSPRDAALVRMRLEGLDYKTMAEKELAGTRPTEQDVVQRTNAIKKQFTRPKTGSLAKFRILLDRMLKKNGLDRRDMLE